MLGKLPLKTKVQLLPGLTGLAFIVLIAISIICIAVGIVVLWVLAGGIVRPIRAATTMLQDISEGGCLFVASSEDTRLLLRRGEGEPTDFSWLGSTFVTDVSPDGRSLLFIDGSPTAGTLGAWVRPLDGGEAIRIADADPGRFSPDGRWVVAASRIAAGPSQLILVPATGGKVRALTSSATASFAQPSFAGPDTILFLRSEKERRDVWRMRTDGTEAEALGVEGCSAPAADPTAGCQGCSAGSICRVGRATSCWAVRKP